MVIVAMRRVIVPVVVTVVVTVIMSMVVMVRRMGHGTRSPVAAGPYHARTVAAKTHFSRNRVMIDTQLDVRVRHDGKMQVIQHTDIRHFGASPPPTRHS